MPGTLFLVATPIGNLEDITLRARRVLSQAALIACEDTRHTAGLLSHLKISTRTVSYHEHNEQARAPELLERLLGGEDIALVTDAGTPLVSDPGYRLVHLAIANSIVVVPIPGPSAALAALAASGLPTSRFYFAGFLSAKRAQFRSELADLSSLEGTTLILYEAPHRIVEALADIAQVAGPDRPVVVARELTKVHEEFLRGSASSIHSALAARPSIRGEFTILIGPPAEQPPLPAEPDALREEVAGLTAAGVPRMDAIKEVARRHQLSKRDLYRMLEQH
jgi:16S rRNA (cytidine1402-2'-O)-methyltransferase